MGEPAGTPKMNIGEVHARLRADFPSLELSKLRYFEAKGLVEPTRTAAGGPAGRGPASPPLDPERLRSLEPGALGGPPGPGGGSRRYSSADIERLRYALVLQRDHHLPLKIIREHLDAVDRGLQPPPL